MCAEKKTNIEIMLGERLRSEVEGLPGGVSALAKALGKARNTIYNWMVKGNIPIDDLLRLGDIGLDVQYVITGERWGALGKRDAGLAAMSGPDRAKAVLDRVLSVQARLGVDFTKEQLQNLMGYAFEHCPTMESLEAFARAAYVVGGVSVGTPKKEAKKKK